MKLTMTKSVLLSVLMAVASTSSVLAEETPMIVGGSEAAVGDYPYFVEMGYCGGALVAPDIVLFAAHCGDWNNKQVSISAYRTGTLSDGAKERYCESWIADPRYNPSTTNYDFALCKLSSPVDIGTDVVLQLNDDNSEPDTGDDLIVMGVGALREGGAGPKVLHHVEVPVVSNQQCNKNSAYGGDITEMMLCAGYPDQGGKDSCQGDSGGPIVKRRENSDGTFVDTHVGVVSWGIGCARKGKPGVYARTSKRFSWIKDTMCGMGSVSSLCSNPPYEPPEPPASCDQELKVEFNTDDYGVETSWTLREKNGPEVMTRKYLFNEHENEHTLCLKDDQDYVLTVGDLEGDGMCYQGKCGNYKLDLNGVRIVTGNGQFSNQKIHNFKTSGGGGGGGGGDDDDDDDDDEPPTTGNCNGNTALQFQLVIKTDRYPEETTWKVKNSDSQVIFSGGNDGFRPNRRYVLPSRNEYMCLAEGQCYTVEVDDSFGDGLESGAFIQGLLGGSQVFRKNGNFQHKQTAQVCVGGGGGGGDSCQDDPAFEYRGNPDKNCANYVGRGSLKSRKKKCRRSYRNKKIFRWCPKSCDEVGVGQC